MAKRSLLSLRQDLRAGISGARVIGAARHKNGRFKKIEEGVLWTARVSARVIVEMLWASTGHLARLWLGEWWAQLGAPFEFRPINIAPTILGKEFEE
jgi:hypothetical protein